MKWPFVSREAYRQVVAERDRLRETNERLMEHTIKMDRIEHGVSEREPKERKKPEPIPDDLETLIAGFENETVRDELRRQAKALRRTGKRWAEITDKLTTEIHEGTVGA